MLLLLSVAARADIPYMPLRVTLRTTQTSYVEGDKISFILTIRNAGDKAVPVLTPGAANSGNKIIYLRVIDPAGNLYVERGMEHRHLAMTIKYLGLPGLDTLLPGDSISVSFFWNDRAHFFDEVPSHHSFDKPLFAGRYLFQAFYNPQGTSLGDSLYHFMQSDEDAQSPDKINFTGPVLSNACPVTITHHPRRRDRY